jgi:membrane fusion protein (multidrug efflux system)
MRCHVHSGRRAGSGSRSRHHPLAAVVALVALALLTACGGEAETESERTESAVTIEAVRLVPETLRDEVALTGQLNAEYEVVLKPEIDGVIKSIEFEEGQPVEGGQVLFRLKDDEQKARRTEAEAHVRLAQDVFDRTQRLASQDISSVARRAKARAELDIAQAKLALAKLQLERTRIRAPFSGVADLRLVAPGDRVSDEDGLVSVAAIDRLQLVFATQEASAGLARTGGTIYGRFVAFPGERFPGVVFFVSPRIDPASRRLIVKAWVDNADHRLKPGMFANVDVMVAVRPGALLVPEAAIVYDRNGSYLWRVDAEKLAEKVPVRIGLRQRGRVEIVEGVEAGDLIVSAGTNKLMAGSQVEVAPAEPVEHARETPAPEREPGAES